MCSLHNRQADEAHDSPLIFLSLLLSPVSFTSCLVYCNTEILSVFFFPSNGNNNRTLRHTLQSLRPIFDIILILFMIITVFSLLGFYLFKDYPNNKVTLISSCETFFSNLRPFSSSHSILLHLAKPFLTCLWSSRMASK